MLRRLKCQKAWQWFCNIAIVVHVFLMLATVSVVLAQCRPLAFVWDKSIKNAVCMPKQTADKFYYFITGTSTNLRLHALYEWV